MSTSWSSTTTTKTSEGAESPATDSPSSWRSVCCAEARLVRSLHINLDLSSEEKRLVECKSVLHSVGFCELDVGKSGKT